jgi:radical SAM protein with 4Fe4S-binding SPASM domain
LTIVVEVRLLTAAQLQNREFYDLPGIRSNHFVLQWHITERCNLKCIHCYQDQPSSDELTFEQLCLIIEQFKALLKKLQEQRRLKKLTGLINVTGGEPLFRQDFFDLLQKFVENRDHFRFGILTNGTLIDADVARRISELNPAFVQVSLEGSKKTNDAIRGEGTFDRITSALQHLAEHGAKTVISFTAHRHNYHEFLDVARIGCQLGVTRVWADRLIPCGAGLALDEQVLTTEETHELFEIMYTARKESQKQFCRTEIYMGRALQFLVGGGEPYHCVAGNSLVALQANGELYPCRRMPINVGNLLETPLVDLYEQCELFQKLRRNEISNGCEICSFNRKCRGGLKCLSYAVYGNSFVADPGCWREKGRQTQG